MKNRLLFTFLIFTSCLAFNGCAPVSESSCLDGSNNHLFVFHEKEEYEEKKGHVAYYQCEKCNKLFNENKIFVKEIDELPAKRKIILPNKLNGRELNYFDSIVSGYLSLNDEDKIATYLYNHRNDTNCKIEGINLTWEDNNSSKVYAVELCKDNTFNEICYSENAINESVCIKNIVPGFYYYRIKDTNNNYSLVDSFKISDYRIIETGHSLSSYCVENMRDLGGKKANNGDFIKYEMLYRSALPSSNDKALFKKLNIKTELDLRMYGDALGSKNEIQDFKGVNPETINYVIGLGENQRCWPQYDQIFDASNKSYIQNYFQKIFNLLADSSSYPLVFHCRSGADRTGTLAYIICGLCGISYSDLVKDFELTSFYKANRWRSNIIYDTNKQSYTFTKDGDMQTADNVRFNKFHNQLLNEYGDKTGSISLAILNFLKEYCRVDVNSIKATLSHILLGNGYLELFK